VRKLKRARLTLSSETLRALDLAQVIGGVECSDTCHVCDTIKPAATCVA
jgi:hypothetical protein